MRWRGGQSFDERGWAHRRFQGGAPQDFDRNSGRYQSTPRTNSNANPLTPRTDNVQHTTLRGTVTVVAADNSIGVRGDDGRSLWVRLPEQLAKRPQVGDRVEVTGQWKDNFLVSDSLRLR
jgi:hypothetical protein